MSGPLTARRVPQTQLDALRSGLTTIAVTGTNGKTTTVGMIASIVGAAGQTPVRVTTLGMWVGDEQTATDGGMTSFLRTIERAREHGARTIALEVTSRALEGGFAERWPADVAVFTNLTQDHLDRHGTPERYLAAKARLFVGPRAPRAAVLNTTDPASALLAEVTPKQVARYGYCPTRGVPIAGPASTLAACRIEQCEISTQVSLHPSPLAHALGDRLSLRVLGDFNADNALAAAVATHVAGFAPDEILAGLEQFPGAPGRFEPVATQPLCIVDFAHSPDALTRVLMAARTLAEGRAGRLGCVFGCGGDRDAHKRAQMGEVGDRMADAIWLTTDNPRSEDAAAIAAMVRAGAGGMATWREVPNRMEAIAAAIAWAGDDDLVVVAGRGAETHQVLAGGPTPFCDRQAVLSALASRGGRGGE